MSGSCNVKVCAEVPTARGLLIQQEPGTTLRRWSLVHTRLHAMRSVSPRLVSATSHFSSAHRSPAEKVETANTRHRCHPPQKPSGCRKVKPRGEILSARFKNLTLASSAAPTMPLVSGVKAAATNM